MFQFTRCDHHDSNCFMFFECCQKFHKCMECHMKFMGESCETESNQVTKLGCVKCNTIQPVSNKCVKCGITFGNYFCVECMVFENANLTVLHCQKCGCCNRFDRGYKIIHCEKCNKCMKEPIYREHKCLENNWNSNCPICCEPVRGKMVAYVLSCGHIIHGLCYNRNKETNPDAKCPICKIGTLI